SVVSGLLALLRVERDKIGAAPYDGCLRTLVEGIKPFVIRLGVKVLMTCFPVRPLWSSLYVEVIRHVATDDIFSAVRKLAGFLKTHEYWPRDKFWDLVSECFILCLEMLETSVLGLGQDLGLITALGGSMTTSTYISRIVFNLIPSRFKVCDMFSAYVTCVVWLGVKDVFTQLAKDVVGQGLDHGSLTLRDDQEVPRMIRKTFQVMRFWRQIEAREEGCQKKCSGELCTRFAVLPFSAIILGIFCGFGERKFSFSEKFLENVF
uniref:Uncharacterized protein n=1 Tax=Brassica oleracea var. oleracea TaxID=109376 RepID=A0A0D2ZTH9_BRAOL